MKYVELAQKKRARDCRDSKFYLIREFLYENKNAIKRTMRRFITQYVFMHNLQNKITKHNETYIYIFLNSGHSVVSAVQLSLCRSVCLCSEHRRCTVRFVH